MHLECYRFYFIVMTRGSPWAGHAMRLIVRTRTNSLAFAISYYIIYQNDIMIYG